MFARVRARFITFSRSIFNAVLLLLSRSAGIVGKAAMVAISLASAKFVLIKFNSCSIFSNSGFDNTFSGAVIRYHHGPVGLTKQASGKHKCNLALKKGP